MKPIEYDAFFNHKENIDALTETIGVSTVTKKITKLLPHLLQTLKIHMINCQAKSQR